MSKFTKEYILNDAKEKNVEFVRLQFTDVFGSYEKCCFNCFAA